MVRFRSRRKALIASAGVALLFSSFVTQAATCEESFKTIGDPRNGLAFLAERTVPGLSIDSALGQIRQYGLDEKFVVGADAMNGKDGQVYLVQDSSNPPVVVTFTASPDGTVGLATKLARGQKMDTEAGKQYLCGMLGKIKPGKEGEAIAAEAHSKSDANRMTDTTAVELSERLGKEAKKLSNAMNSGSFKDLLLGTRTSPDTMRDRDAMFAPLVAKYVGRKYRIDGEVYTASINQYSGVGEVAWLVTKTRGLLSVRQDDDMNNSQFTVICAMAKDQLPLVTMLRIHDFAKLEGTVDSINLSGIHLKDCRQAN
ncbi:hypothetical protein L2Y96_07485 [Luteibacter aegosomaticola]|jgi:hypothetical protein|uniref:hypothetical protein n=1 Tax=Luteibacter aegosomaticola TaxID=2911538 RepID=UPI001FFA5E42|nr:hypothetical protein [Luteibacter aegosomaticola]UPG91602.1 hypothetical protein L2Y96_07485 [Luteibacter aegosomaticola]